MAYEMTVIVLSYCPDYKKLFQTLFSVVRQKNICFEIIVADDGTPDFDRKRVEDWFAEYGFAEYTIVSSRENQGTVKNIYGALKKAGGTYVKVISPGDYLYGEDTLKHLYDFMCAGQCIVCFGRVVYYAEQNGDYVLYPQKNPKTLRPYIKQNLKKIQRNYLIFKDYIVGAALACRTEEFLSYMGLIADRVVYAEDCAVICMVADGIPVSFFDECILWYEYGTGISTQKSNVWQERLFQDNKKCFELLKERHESLEKAYDITYNSKKKDCLKYKIERTIHSKALLIYNFFHKTVVHADKHRLEQIIMYKERKKECR